MTTTDFAPLTWETQAGLQKKAEAHHLDVSCKRTPCALQATKEKERKPDGPQCKVGSTAAKVSLKVGGLGQGHKHPKKMPWSRPQEGGRARGWARKLCPRSNFAIDPSKFVLTPAA